MTIRLLGMAGSLRSGSRNQALLRAAAEVLPDGVVLDTFDLGPIPFYNGDVEAVGFPEPVMRLRSEIVAADGLVLVTPEYNAGVPAVLKNAIDWASRGKGSPLADKPIALAGVGGRAGTGRAQNQLRANLLSTRSWVLNRELALTDSNLFDAELNLVDETARQRLGRHLAELVRMIGELTPR